MKTWTATERGYANGRIIEPGETFSADIPKGSWMEEVKPEPEEKPARRSTRAED